MNNKDVGEYILSCFRDKKPLNEGQSLISVLVWLAIVVLILITLLVPAKAHALDCSWYSVESLKTEGTWKTSQGRMANGEYFADELMVGASRDFPLGSVVRVTNPANGKSCAVVIKDRIGKRFAGKRVDISKRAFSEIACLEQGVIKNVTVEVL